MSPKEYQDLMKPLIKRLTEVCKERNIAFRHINTLEDRGYMVYKVVLEREIYLLWNNGSECGWDFHGYLKI